MSGGITGPGTGGLGGDNTSLEQVIVNGQRYKSPAQSAPAGGSAAGSAGPGCDPSDCGQGQPAPESVTVTATRPAPLIYAAGFPSLSWNQNGSCMPAASFYAHVANVADDISTGASAVSLASGAGALVTSETIVGGVTFGGISAVAGGVALAASSVGFVANVAAGRYGNAGVDAFSMAVGVGTGIGAKSLRAGVQLAREGAGELMSDSASSICSG